MTEQQSHNEILKRLDDMETAQGKRFKAIEDKIDPMFDVFTSVSGFNRVTIIIMKGLAAVGAAILALYVVVEFFRRIGRP